MDRHLDQHLDSPELSALVPRASPTGQETCELSPDAVRNAALHVQSCVDCARKVTQYRRFLDRLAEVAVLGGAPPGTDCPRDVDWYEVAGGLWPEMKARQLIMHAALCNHCGPLLRAATALQQDPTPQEEAFLAKLARPQRPQFEPRSVAPSLPRYAFLKWAVPAVMVLMVVAALITVASRTPLSGASFAQFAASTHRQGAHGDLALAFRSESHEMLNDWLKANLPFPLALPDDVPLPGEDRPYRLVGARLLQVKGKPAVYISYRAQTDPVSLIVTSDSVAAASGGISVDYKKVSFHYRMVEGYKVVTWSLSARTYALVSQEGNNTQRSCMVCHSAMGDRDLSRTPAPPGLAGGKRAATILQ